MGKINDIEQQQWKKLVKGDIDALSELYQKYSDDLYDFGTKLTADSDCIMDSIHDLFLDLYKYRKKLTTPESIKYYLIRSLQRKILKRLKAARKIKNPEEEFYESLEESIEERIIRSENEVTIRYGLQNAVAMLNHNQTELLTMRFTNNKSYEEIAEYRGVTIETVRTSLYRTVKKLRQILSN